MVERPDNMISSINLTSKYHATRKLEGLHIVGKLPGKPYIMDSYKLSLCKTFVDGLGYATLFE